MVVGCDALQQVDNLDEGLGLGIGPRSNGAFWGRVLESMDDIMQGCSDDIVGRAIWHRHFGRVPF